MVDPSDSVSDSCRMDFFRQRARIEADSDAHGTLRRQFFGESDELARLDNRIARLKMRLDRYRPFDT